MTFDQDKVTKFVADMDKKQFNAQELTAIGKVLISLAEVQKETEMLEEYPQSMQLGNMDNSAPPSDGYFDYPF